ncbi:hypothetical protein [Rubrivivax gelatinosus]|uniref:hypothetical protein n=1 Tax=Rubrivivax gelatinosus TaxID=28068 RepID=UPI001908AEB0|nr:hypothetical protein [Rubrivivax gelatinosus]
MSRYLIGWGYAVEIAISALVLLVLCMWLSTESVLAFLRSAALDIATLFGAVMLAAALAFLWTFFSKADTPFFRWLDSKGAFQVYLRATAYAVLVSLLSTFSLVIYKHIDDRNLGLAAAFLLVLALINMYTLVSNVIGLMKLNALFMRQ